MAFTVVQAGSSLQFINDSGVLSTLTLPTGITLRTDVPPRWAIFRKYAVLVNTPEQPLTIDGHGTVRLLCPRAPRTPAILTGVSGGTLSGSFTARYTFFELDASGQLIYETDYSADSNTLTIVSNYLHLAQLDTLPNSTTNGRRAYRPPSGTSVYFPWFDIDGNTATEAQDDMPDAGLGTLSASARGTPPYLSHIAEFRNRLFGVSPDKPDDLRYTEVQEGFAWPSDNAFVVPHAGLDRQGVTCLMPRREALGVGRQNAIFQLTGTDDTNFRIIRLSENVGFVNQETAVIYQDAVFFLWYDGVYRWDNNGITNLSDRRVRSWFTKDATFNRDLFEHAFAVFDPLRKRYILFLALAGSTAIDSWIEYSVESGTWWGPHISSAYTPTSAFVIMTGDNVARYAIGVDETAVVVEQETRNDGHASAIAASATMAPLFGESPDVTTYFGEMTLMAQAQSTGGTLTITPSLGEPGALVAQSALSHTLSGSRSDPERLGIGRAVQLAFTHSGLDQKVEIGDIEIDIATLGRR